MMKKTICFLFVFALIAQICARPGDKDDKAKAAADKAKEAAGKDKDDADKPKGDVEKVAKEAKDKVVTAKDTDDADDDDDDKEAAAAKAKAEAKAKAAAHAAAEHKKPNHGKHHKMGDMVRDTAAIGEGFIKKGADMMGGMFDNFPF